LETAEHHARIHQHLKQCEKCQAWLKRENAGLDEWEQEFRKPLEALWLVQVARDGEPSLGLPSYAQFRRNLS
jgi:hypothetical protein